MALMDKISGSEIVISGVEITLKSGGNSVYTSFSVKIEAICS